jgi:hypothetical protein
MVRGARDPDRGHRGDLVAFAVADRCGTGHHQQPGSNQHARSGPLSHRRRKAGDLPGRDFACRHPGARIHALDFPQRLLASDGGVHRPNSDLFRPPAGQRTTDGGAPFPPTWRRAAHGSDRHRARRDLHVDGSVRVKGRAGAGPRRAAGVAGGWRLSHAGRSAAT